MVKHQITNRGDGPKIEGTRITVYLIYEYALKGYSRDGIAAELGLSSRQVQVALDYIDAHKDDVREKYGHIRARIEKGNPDWIETRLQANREKLKGKIAARQQSTAGVEPHGGTDVGQ